jgi:hypothetical protein
LDKHTRGRRRVSCFVVLLLFRGWARGPLYPHHAPSTHPRLFAKLDV